MRDILVLGAVTAAALYALLHPYVGVLAWTWVSIMNPHRLAWSFAVNFPVAMIVGGCTLLGVVFTKDYKRLPMCAPVLVLILFMAYMCFSAAVAIVPTMEMFTRIMKILLMILVAIAVLETRKQIDLLIWVLVISIGFYGVKGGIFTILQGGSFRVWGPEGSFIEGNNEVGLAIIMTIPLMRYLQLTSPNKWVRRGMVLAMVLSALAALGTQSRGALLAIIAMTLLLWLRSDSKIISGVVIAVVSVALVAFMPSTWEERMQTIGVENMDSSALGRINAWQMAWNLAVDRPIGGGFEVITPELFARYAPVPGDIHAAHSIYFQILGEHGFPGLFLFLTLWFLVWRYASRMRQRAKADPELKWAGDLGRMVHVSLIGYLVGGAFLSLAYFDLPYNLLVLVVAATEVIARRSQKRGSPTPTSQHHGAAPAAAQRHYA